jgi:hypothetical protein
MIRVPVEPLSDVVGRRGTRDFSPRCLSQLQGPKADTNPRNIRYKGMAQSSASGSSKSVTPQATGFSQIHSRVGAGEGSGQAMSVLLSWHEKVRHLLCLHSSAGAVVAKLTGIILTLGVLHSLSRLLVPVASYVSCRTGELCKRQRRGIDIRTESKIGFHHPYFIRKSIDLIN